MLYFLLPHSSPNAHSWDTVSWHLLRELARGGTEFAVQEYMRGDTRSADLGILKHAGPDDTLVVMARMVPTIRRFIIPFLGACRARKVCYCMAPDSTLVEPAEARIYDEHFSGVLVPSSFGQHSLKDSGVQVPVLVVRHGYDPAVFAPAQRNFFEQRLKILYVGKVECHKNIQVLYQALRIVQHTAPIDLVVKTQFDRAGICKGFTSNVRHIFGSIPREELVALYQNAHLGILCSYGEGFGLPGLESLATGMPLIATRFGGMLEYANDSNSFLINGTPFEVPNHTNGNCGAWHRVNAFQLANFLISLHHDRSRIQKKAAVARSSVEHLTWKNSAKEFMAAVGSLGEKPAEVVFPPAGSGEVLDPATSAAVKDGTWWTELAQRVGPGYVALAPQRLEHQTGEIQKLLTPILGARKFSLGLDYGCGACRFTPEIATHCTNVLAADLVDPCRPADLPANVAFQKVAPDGGHWLRLKDGSVEFLWCSLVLQHICSAELFLNVAAELRRVLAPGALVVILDDLGPASTTRRIHPREPAFLAAVLGLSEYTSRPVDIDQRFSKHQLLVGVKA